ncbi:neprilysin-11-like [Ornithodoros turicata]|uniref:neprilysin-11-like n=1 Tax=Ornithodoros turicata TaxID=34597 RepID=UPI003139E563
MTDENSPKKDPRQKQEKKKPVKSSSGPVSATSTKLQGKRRSPERAGKSEPQGTLPITPSKNPEAQKESADSTSPKNIPSSSLAEPWKDAPKSPSVSPTPEPSNAGVAIQPKSPTGSDSPKPQKRIRYAPDVPQSSTARSSPAVSHVPIWMPADMTAKRASPERKMSRIALGKKRLLSHLHVLHSEPKPPPEVVMPIPSKPRRPKLSVSPFKRKTEVVQEKKVTVHRNIILFPLVVALTIMLGVGIGFLLRTGSPLVSGSKEVPRESPNVCRSKECRQATSFIDSVANYSVDPCMDIQRYVCGRWAQTKPGRGRFRGDYLSETFRNSTLRVHEKLMNLSNMVNAIYYAESNMAVYYKSCYNFMTDNESSAVTSIIKYFRIDPKTWHSVKTLEDLVFLAASTMREFAWRFFFDIYAELNIVHINLGTSLNTVLTSVDVSTEEYIRMLVGYFKLERLARTGILERIGADVDAVIKKFKPAPYATIQVRQLNETAVPLATWLRVVQLFAKENITSDFSVRVRGWSEIKDIVSVLGSYDAAQVSIYNLFLFLAHTLKYELFKRDALRGGDFLSIRTRCLQETARYGKKVYASWLSRHLQHRDTTREVTTMYLYLREAVLKLLDDEELSDEARRVMANAVYEIQHMYYGVGTSERLKLRPGVNITDCFPVVLAQAAQIEAQYQYMGWDVTEKYPHNLWQSSGTLGYVPKYKAIVTPTPLLNPDMFYVGSQNDILNLATLGATMAEGMIQAALLVHKDVHVHERDHIVGSLLECYNEHEVNLRNRSLAVRTDDALMLAAIVKGIATAHKVVRQLHPVASVTEDKLFFIRSCLRFCTDRKTTIPYEMACEYAAAVIREFRESFNCTTREYVQCG